MKEVSEQSTTIWSAAFVALLAVNFLRMMGQSIGNTIVPLYAHELGATAEIVGFVAGAFAITALAIRPFAGPAFDSFSKKRLFLIFGIVLAAAGYAYAFANTVPMIVAVRLLHGVGMGCTAPLGLAIVSEILPVSKMNSGISIYTVAQTVALAVGPAFGVWAVDAIGYFATFMVMGTFLAVTCVVVAVFVKERSVDRRPPYQLRLNRMFSRRALGLTAVMMLMSIAFSCVGTFLVIYGKQIGIDDIAWFFTVNAGCMLATRPLFGWLSDKYGANKVVVPTMAMFALSFIVLAFANGMPMIILAAVVSACGFGAASPLVQAVVFKCVPLGERGSASNTSYIGLDIGNLVGPYAGGMVVELLIPVVGVAAAYSGMWLAMLVPIAASCALFIALGPRIRRYEQEAAAEDAGE